MGLFSYNRDHLSFVTVLLFFTCLVLSPCSPRAQMCEVSESDLSRVVAQSGITYVIGSSRFRATMDSYRISDTDHTPYHWIELNDITIDDGSGNYFSMDTPADEQDFNRYDVATDTTGLTSIFMNLSLNVEPRTYTVGDFVFCDQSLGSLRVENLRTSPSNLFSVSGRPDGLSGINMEYQTELMLDSARFAYNTTPEYLGLNGVHLSQNAAGDPTTPSAWTFDGKFKFGDWDNGNPATVDVLSYDKPDGTFGTSVFCNIPMSGTIRVQSVQFGGNEFGPCAIDNIKVHRLGIQLPGN